MNRFIVAQFSNKRNTPKTSIFHPYKMDDALKTRAQD
jgi:hypothetical protein